MDHVTLEALQNDLEFYRPQQSVLEMEEEIRAVIDDNQQLSAQVGQLLRERVRCGGPGRSEGDAELRAQLTLLAKERDSLHVLWQTSQKTIEALENELKVYQNYGDGEHEQNRKEDRRDIELKLETALTDYIELETKYKTLQTKLSNLEQECKYKDKYITDCKEKIDQLQRKLEELNKNLEECRINLEAEKKNNDNIKQQFILSQKDAVNRVNKEAEAKAKVAEALQLYEIVFAQKNEAFKKIAEITGELSQTKQDLARCQRNAEESYKNELDELREKYNEKITDMLAHIRNLDSELIEKGMLLGKALREIKILKQENENFIKQQKDCLHALDPKVQLAEQRMETMLQELIASERRNIQLVCDKQCLAIDMQRAQDNHARETKRRDWEENLLKTQCEELKAQVEHLQKSLDETHGMVTKLQNMLSSRTELTQRMVNTKEEELLELNKHLENQMELSRKWKESYVDMTEKLKKKLDEIVKENKELRSQLELPNIGSSEQEDEGNSS